MKAIFLALILTSISAHADELARDYTLKISYDVSCPNQDEKSFPGITGSVMVRGRTLRLDLLKYNHDSEATLSFSTQPKPEELNFTWNASPDCQIKTFAARVEEETTPFDVYVKLAREHSPFLVVRKDQVLERTRDLPLTVTYSIMPTSQGTTKLRYTIFFSNETVKGIGSTTKAASLANYGRRTDIEWMYDVEFDSEMKVVSRKYQGGIVRGLGHATHSFKGRFLPGSQHPVLFNRAMHNVFRDNDEFTADGNTIRDGYHFVVREELTETAGAREWWQWRNPWSFDLSDRELRRGHGAGEFEAPSCEYLYVLLTGKMKRSRLRMNFAGEGFFARSRKINKLGEGLWGKQSFIAIKMSEMEQNLGGTFSLLREKRGLVIRHWGTLDLQPLKFFRLKADPEKGFTPIEVTDHFKCDEDFQCEYRNTPYPQQQDQNQSQQQAVQP